MDARARHGSYTDRLRVITAQHKSSVGSWHSIWQLASEGDKNLPLEMNTYTRVYYWRAAFPNVR